MSAITICFFLTVVVKLTLLLYIIGYVGFPRTSGAGRKDFTVNYDNTTQCDEYGHQRKGIFSKARNVSAPINSNFLGN